MTVEKKYSALLVALSVTALAACASKPPQVPYPVFVQVAGVPDSFLAGLPGTRAKIFSSDSHSRRMSMLLQLPADWKFGTGAAPGKSLEIYLLEGDITLGEFTLQPGGYAFLPSGSMGVNMSSRGGASMLYFLDDAHPDAVIQTPIVSSSELLSWQASSESAADFGFATKELRSDPGSGAKTWLLKIDPGAVQSWQQASAVVEGYLVSGQYQHSECSSGIPLPGNYTTGGYFLRPAMAVNGGPDSAAIQTSIWLLRAPENVVFFDNLNCGVGAEQ